MGRKKPLSESELGYLIRLDGKINGVSLTYRKQVKGCCPSQAHDEALELAQDSEYWEAVRGIQLDDLSLKPLTLDSIAQRTQAVTRSYAKITRPYPFERPRDKFEFLSRAEYEERVAYLEACRSQLRALFLASERGERIDGYREMDGLEYKRKDDEFLAEIDRLTRQLGAGASLIAKSKNKGKGRDVTKKSKGNWRNLSSAEQAQAFKQSGFEIRVIELPKRKQFQVLARPG